MSRENVEIVLMSLDPNRVDDSFIAQYCEPGVEIHDEPTMPDARVWRGHAGMREFIAELDQRWAEFNVHPERFVEAPTRLWLSERNAGGKRSGVDLEAWPWAAVYELRECRFTRIRFFHDPADALDAGGLRE